MPLITDLPLDISKSPQQILIDKLNAINGLNLSLDDFTFTDPVSITETAISNTKVTLTPKLVSQFYNAIDLFYKRIDITTILSNSAITIRRDSETKLSDIIPKINAAFGINMTNDDYYDTDLSILYPNNPDAEIPVTISTKHTSLLFKGSYIFSINRLTTTTSPTTGEDSIIYAVLSNPNNNIFKSKIEAVTTDAEVLSQYQFMYNATTISMVEIRRAFKLANQDIALIGQFDFTGDIGGGQETYSTTSIITTPSGGIRSVSNTAFQKASMLDYATVNGLEVIYAIYTEASSQASDFKVFKFNSQGQEDTAYSDAMNLGFKPTFIKVCTDGKVYAVSSVYTESGIKKVKIIRLTVSGVIDSSFTPIVITSTGSSDPFLVQDIVVNYTAGAPNGIYVSLVPNVVISSLSIDIPVINGTAIVPGGQIQDFGYLPVIKVKQDGSLDALWDVKQKNYLGSAIHDLTGSTLVYAEHALAVFENTCTWMTFIKNPITGFKHRIPLQANSLGSLQRISGDGYYQSYRLENIRGFEALDKGSLVAMGPCQLPIAGGGWASSIDSIVLYKKDTSPLNVLYKAPVITGNQTTIQQIICRKD